VTVFNTEVVPAITTIGTYRETIERLDATSQKMVSIKVDGYRKLLNRWSAALPEPALAPRPRRPRDPRLDSFLKDEEEATFQLYREMDPEWRGRWVAHMLKLFHRMSMSHPEARGTAF
jgi:hypothetical protein